MNHLRTSILVSIILVFAFGIVGCPQPADQDGGDGEEPEAEVLKLAMSGAYRPLSMTDAEGSLVGFDADIATEVATRTGREPELVQTEWAGIQAGLQTAKYDLIWLHGYHPGASRSHVLLASVLHKRRAGLCPG